MAEHTPQPGVTWERQLQQVERIELPEDDGDSPFGWRDLTDLPPRPNRAARRAAARAARRDR